MCKLTINYLLLLTVLFHNTAYSRQDTMLINDSIIFLINELNNIKDKNITQLEKIFGCKFYKDASHEDELDWLLDKSKSSTAVFTCNKVKNYPPNQQYKV